MGGSKKKCSCENNLCNNDCGLNKNKSCNDNLDCYQKYDNKEN